ncbi:hypothetical protein FAZ19_13485 [Sphingobacterium alkalisoli]|uniref:Lipopolysaccharide biosynthesis protein n=1 Tax=Sphingobacterium alkalisoli TaxID=1874115 RepID=A0A4U0GYE1_9SPHI|nr:hypothetical protein [Sphingobacterium alkalisoli]TJY64220.1 hypothetical protein FAZ19_13485 [Sphingobacterium alkalisoli]GGH23098.1 hypothetical protein GCM10011418_30100 [Sphingobacterium alkalisoli]
MELIGEDKTILLAMPDWFLYRELKKELENFGFTVIGVPFSNSFKYARIWDRLYNLFRKVVLNDKSYKNQLKYQANGKHIAKIVGSLKNKVDFALMIRADFYPAEVVNLIKEKSKILVGYQWDGVHRFPAIQKLIPLFDRFFVFDPDDLNLVPNILPCTNFYLNSESVQECTLDLYYVGSFVKERIDLISKFSEFLQQNNFNYLIHIVTDKERYIQRYKNSAFTISNEYVSYEQNIYNVKKSRILVDFLQNVHQGLSFRVFEALGSRKKLITDNVEVDKYDFYHPNNIFIVKDESFEGLSEFVKKPYVDLDPVIVNKYSFKNWISYVLDIKPYVPIFLPVSRQ